MYGEIMYIMQIKKWTVKAIYIVVMADKESMKLNFCFINILLQ